MTRLVGEREERLREAFSTGLRLLEQGTQSSRRAGVEVAELEEARAWLASVQAALTKASEERLREALEAIYKRACATWTGETSGDPLHIALASIAHTADTALASSPSPPDRESEADQIEERLKRTVDEFYPLAEKCHNDALKDALVAAVRSGLAEKPKGKEQT